MGKIDQKLVRERLSRYLADYDVEDPKIKGKVDHMQRVARLSRRIALSLNLSTEDTDLAWLIGLLHDIGRFEQLRRYHTFQDYKSINHAGLGADLLFHDWLIREFYPQGAMADYQLMNKAIRLHNVYQLPENLTQRERLFCDILRDADRADILRISYETPSLEALDVSDQDQPAQEISDTVYEDFKAHREVIRVHEKTELDFALGYVSLIFGLTFPESFRIVSEQGYAGRMLDYQGNDPVTKGRMEQIRQIVRSFTESHSRSEKENNSERPEKKEAGRDTYSEWQKQSLETATEVVDTSSGADNLTQENTPERQETAREEKGPQPAEERAAEPAGKENPGGQAAEENPAVEEESAEPAEEKKTAETSAEEKPAGSAAEEKPVAHAAEEKTAPPEVTAQSYQPGAESVPGAQEKEAAAGEGKTAQTQPLDQAAQPAAEEEASAPASEKETAAPAAQEEAAAAASENKPASPAEEEKPASPAEKDRPASPAAAPQQSAQPVRPEQGSGQAKQKSIIPGIIALCVIGACAIALIWMAVSLKTTVDGGASRIQPSSGTGTVIEGSGEQAQISIEQAGPGEQQPSEAET